MHVVVHMSDSLMYMQKSTIIKICGRVNNNHVNSYIADTQPNFFKKQAGCTEYSVVLLLYSCMSKCISGKHLATYVPYY